MTTSSGLGAGFARALAAKNRNGILELLDPEVDFRGLTPNRAWQAGDAEAVASMVLGEWFEEDDHVDELVELETAAMSDRERISYRLRGHNADGPFLVEQQAYLAERDGRIIWMRVLCSGFRPG